MVQEEKDILIADLCGRLPYGLIIKCNDGFRQSKEILVSIDVGNGLINYDWRLTDIKPYLRPMSSMSEEEIKEYTSYCFEQPFLQKDKTPNLGSVPMCIYWLNAHHFDYRGLIPKDLALEAKDGMYNN